MRKTHQNLKVQEIKLAPDTVEDLWYLSTLIDPGDIVEASTIRKIKIGDSEAKTTVVKRPVFAHLRVEEVELSGDTLRVSGIVVGGSEDLPRGTHHSIRLELHESILIRKPQWLSYQLAKVTEACSGGAAPVLIVLHDREEAFIARMTRTGYEVLLHLSGEVAKKDMPSASKDFYAEVSKQIGEYATRYKPERIILASPAFFKEDLAKVVPSELRKKIIFATASSVGTNGIDEVLKRDEVKSALTAHKSATEMKEVESLFGEIGKDGCAAYGWKDVSTCVQHGAVKKLLVSEGLLKEKREKKRFGEIDYLMRETDRMNGEIHIISDEHEGGKRLLALGGIAAITRYKLTF